MDIPYHVKEWLKKEYDRIDNYSRYMYGNSLCSYFDLEEVYRIQSSDDGKMECPHREVELIFNNLRDTSPDYATFVMIRPKLGPHGRNLRIVSNKYAQEFDELRRRT